MRYYSLVFIFLLASAGLLAQAPKISNLSVTGENIKWYDSPTGGTEYTSPATTNLVNGQIYYASQTVNGVESATRMAVSANLVTQEAPTPGTHTPSQTQIVWNWNTATGAAGYKWSTANDYGGALPMGNVLTTTETGLTCNTAYTRYVWAYNASGCVSAVTTLTQATTACLPTVTTTGVTSVTWSAASSGGNVTSDGGATVTSRGVCWSTSVNPTTANSKTSNGSGTGAYSSSITGLNYLTTYHVRAYAVNSAGTAYGNDVSFTTPLAIGCSYQGGIVAYINGTGLHGFVAASSDQSTGYFWSNIQASWIGTTGTDIGNGWSNTISIISQSGHTSSAAQLCRNYSGGGYNDWYLPSRDELIQMYSNRSVIGGFSGSSFYWSSSEWTGTGGQNGRALYFGDGITYYKFKYNTYYVRAVRSF